MKHEFLNVKQVFDRYKIINVPYYQRDYVWGTKNNGRNLYKFIDDIFNQYNDNPTSQYFIGTLAFCSSIVNDVIDGQQRLTSLILILSILSKLKCSQSIKDECVKLLIPEDDKFVIQEEFYLTEELKFNLGLPNNYNSQNYNANISRTVDRIKSQIINAWSEYTENWYDGLYNFILNNVSFISLEYNNINESLKYFLNINSLSIQLTQSEIFYSILSQSIRIAKTGDSIFNIRQKIKELGSYVGMSKDIEGYKAYDDKSENGITNVIYIFLNAYFKKDSNILTLGETGIGKWMSFYRNDVFNDPISASKFVDKFTQYLKDLEFVYKNLSNMSVCLNPGSSLYITWTLLQYESYYDITSVLVSLFKTKHCYIEGENDLYLDGTKNIDLYKLNEIGKRLNLTLIWNYVRSNTKRTAGFIENIAVNADGNYKKSIDDIVADININEIFNLNYNDHKAVSNVNVKDYSRLIKVILGCQESFLDKTADPSHDFSEYLSNILTRESFSIEHLYSVKEYTDKERLSNWKNKKSKFYVDQDFDNERFRFENLSLLDKQTNSLAGDDEIKDKLNKYKNARKILGSNWEYLIQSYVEGSEYYKNQNIQSLGLPERKLINIDQNTWELSPNNREFNIVLLRKAIEEIANK
jgi:hypothetical protein